MSKTTSQSDQPILNTADVDMSVEIAGVKLANPLLTASGTCGYATEYAPYTDLSKLGAFTTKSITVEPRQGNQPQRIVETHGGMLNAIGLANVGLERFIQDKIPEVHKLNIPVFVNVAGHSLKEYVTVCRRLAPISEISALELNVSCPNVADGLFFGTQPKLLQELVTAAKEVVGNTPLIVKLSPNTGDICEMARAAIDGGADALSMVNTFQGMAINIHTHHPLLANNYGGLSGPAIKPLAVYLVHQVYSKVAKDRGIPIIGMGGIRHWKDAVEFTLAGATALAVGTALFLDPDAPVKIATGLRVYLAEKGIARWGNLIGKVELNSP